MSHILIDLSSEADTRNLLSLDTAQEFTQALWPTKDLTNLLEYTSHIIILPSEPEVNTVLMSLDKSHP